MFKYTIAAAPSAMIQNPALPTPKEIAKDLRLLEVMHYDFFGAIKTGYIIGHTFVLGDMLYFFRKAYKLRFPIHSVIPVSYFDWDDDASCAANNSSGHNMRYIAGSQRFSLHSIGCAYDINPRQNPCFDLTDGLVYQRTIPENGVYVPGTPGTLQRAHPLVRSMVKRRWTWGGGWDFPIDNQHLQKNRGRLPPELASWVK